MCICVSRADRVGWRLTPGKMLTTVFTRSSTVSASCSKSIRCHCLHWHSGFMWCCTVTSHFVSDDDLLFVFRSSEDELPAPTAHEEKVNTTNSTTSQSSRTVVLTFCLRSAQVPLHQHHPSRSTCLYQKICYLICLSITLNQLFHPYPFGYSGWQFQLILKQFIRNFWLLISKP